MAQFLGKKVGIVGGGQLGKMMALAAHRIGLKVCVLDQKDCPCSDIVTEHIIGDYQSNGDILILSTRACEVVTVETEHADVCDLAILERLCVNVQPTSDTLRIIQDKFAQKVHLL